MFWHCWLVGRNGIQPVKKPVQVISRGFVTEQVEGKTGKWQLKQMVVESCFHLFFSCDVLLVVTISYLWNNLTFCNNLGLVEMWLKLPTNVTVFACCESIKCPCYFVDVGSIGEEESCRVVIDNTSCVAWTTKKTGVQWWHEQNFIKTSTLVSCSHVFCHFLLGSAEGVGEIGTGLGPRGLGAKCSLPLKNYVGIFWGVLDSIDVK